MPSYRVGGGVEGAASTVLDIVQRRQAAAAEQEKQQREWDQRLRELVISNADKYDEKFVSALISGQARNPADYLQQQRQSIDRRLPQTPFVAGPGGGFITGSTVEAAPGYTVPRPDVVSAMTPSLIKPRTRPVYSLDASGRPTPVGTIPYDAHLLTKQSDALSSMFGGETNPVNESPQGGDLRQRAIQELQLAGAPITEANIKEAMRQLAQQ